ncbi:MAG: recombination protein RecR [Proteobacteria bacterium]|nr:MAG: recombination protein RecR [Pseudomonadota bacterium]
MKNSLEKFNNLVDAFNALPTVGKKSAMRFAYHLVLKDSYGGMKLAYAIESAIRNTKKCELCGGLSEHEVCDICLDDTRDSGILCLVESVKDMLVLEENGAYEGLYFVLDSLDEEMILKLEKRIEENGVQEIIFALTPGLSSDGIMLFIEDKLSKFDLKFTKIAQGVPTGVNLENVDTLSLSKALQSRTKI